VAHTKLKNLMVSKNWKPIYIGYIPVFSVGNIGSAYYSLLTGSLQCGYVTTS